MSSAIKALYALTTKFRRTLSVMAVLALALNPMFPIVSLMPVQAVADTTEPTITYTSPLSGEIIDTTSASDDVEFTATGSDDLTEDEGELLGAGTGGPGDTNGNDGEPTGGNQTSPLTFTANTTGSEFTQAGATDSGDVQSESDDNTDTSDTDGETLQSTDVGDDSDTEASDEDDGLPIWWWLLILAAVLGGLWLIAARRSSDE